MARSTNKAFEKLSEELLQTNVESYLQLKDVKYIHIPGKLQRYIWNQKVSKIPPHIAFLTSRAFKGLPDIIAFSKSGKFLMIELKSPKGRLTQEQEKWKEYGMHVVRDFPTAKNLIDEFIALDEKMTK